MRHRTLSLMALSRWAAPDGRPRRWRLLAVLAAAYAIFVVTYLTVNVYSIGRTTRSLWLPGEAALPFVPEFEFLYVLGYVFPLIAVFYLAGARELRRLLLAIVLTLAVAYATYMVFPVYLERPVLEVNSVATFMLSLEYKDPSYNHFPSLHIAISWLIYLSCRRSVRYHGLVLLVLLGITVSTLFVKQHYFVDIAYGVGLALAAWWASALLDDRIVNRHDPHGASPDAVR